MLPLFGERIHTGHSGVHSRLGAMPPSYSPARGGIRRGLPPQQLMMARPSFGPGETAAPRKRGDTPSPFTGRAGEGLAEKLLNITHTSLVAVSQDAGESGVA